MWVLEGDLVLNISFPTHQPHQHLKTRKDSYQFPGGLLWGIKWGNPLKVLASVLVTEYSIKVIDHFIILIILLSFHYLNSFIVIIIVAEAGWILWLPQWSYKQHLLLLSERSHFLNGTKKRLKTHQKKKRVLKTPESHMSQTETPSGKLGHCTMKKELLYSLPIITTPCKHLNKKEKNKQKLHLTLRNVNYRGYWNIKALPLLSPIPLNFSRV